MRNRSAVDRSPAHLIGKSSRVLVTARAPPSTAELLSVVQFKTQCFIHTYNEGWREEIREDREGISVSPQLRGDP